MPNEKDVKNQKARPTLVILKSPEHEQSAIYGSLFNMLATQKEAIMASAFELYLEAQDRGVEPQDMNADAALVALDLAEQSLVLVDMAGEAKVDYLDPTEDKLTPSEVKHVLTGYCDAGDVS